MLLNASTFQNYCSFSVLKSIVVSFIYHSTDWVNVLFWSQKHYFCKHFLLDCPELAGLPLVVWWRNCTVFKHEYYNYFAIYKTHVNANVDGKWILLKTVDDLLHLKYQSIFDYRRLCTVWKAEYRSNCSPPVQHPSKHHNNFFLSERDRKWLASWVSAPSSCTELCCSRLH